MLLSGTAGEAAAAPACPLFQERQPNDPRPAVMPTGLAVGLEPPRAPGAAGTVCPKDRSQGNGPWTDGRDWFPRCSGSLVRCTRLTESFSKNLGDF